MYLEAAFGHVYSLGASTYFWVAVAQISPSTEASTSATTRRRDDFTMVARAALTVSPGPLAAELRCVYAGESRCTRSSGA